MPRHQKIFDSVPEGMMIGQASAIAHHGELLQGVFRIGGGGLRRGLITLPYSDLKSRATFWPSHSSRITVRPSALKKAARAAALTLDHLGLEGVGGELTIEKSTIPVGHGYGSSTADVVAAIKATARSASRCLTRATVCKLAVEAEGASDAIAYGSQPVLFAHREGTIVEFMPGDFPRIIVVGGQSRSGPINTDDLPPARYSNREIEEFSILRALAVAAIRHNDARKLCHVARMSAEMSQRHLPKPDYEKIRAIAERFDADGIQVAHSGSLIGILFDASRTDVRVKSASVAAALTGLGLEGTQCFHVNAGGPVV